MLREQKPFTFTVSGQPDDTFDVITFTGSEGLSTVYRFVLDLVSEEASLNLDDVAGKTGRLSVLRHEDDIHFNGIIEEVEQMHRIGDTSYYYYRAILVPRLWLLSQTQNNRIFSNKSIKEVLEAVLNGGHLGLDIDYQFNLNEKHPKREYICQYRESDLHFIQRWMEREGMYFFFEHTKERETVIITDNKSTHQVKGDVSSVQPSGQEWREEAIQRFRCTHKVLPSRVKLVDYYYEQPSFSVEHTAKAAHDDWGEIYRYGDIAIDQYSSAHIDDEVKRLAKIRLEAITCRGTTFHGESNAAFIRPGSIYSVEGHDRFDDDYLMTELTHEGNQASRLGSAVANQFSTDTNHDPSYRNSFAAVPASVQFRPNQDTEKPRFYGSITATIDAEGDGTYPEFDEEGRYKVVFPFDCSGSNGGKASAWLRMMEPYAGENRGIHFPLYKGTEVLVTFIDGDPDRPVITGAMANGASPNVVTHWAHPCNILETDNTLVQTATAGWRRKISTRGSDSNADFTFKKPPIPQTGQLDMTTQEETNGQYIVDKVEGPQYRYAAGNRYAYLFGSSLEVKHAGLGSSHHTASSLITKMEAYGLNGVRTYDNKSATWEDLLEAGHVTLGEHDTFTMQRGNIYDFGGYWNYNLGNSYEENYVRQEGQTVNQHDSEDLLDQGGPDWTKIDTGRLKGKNKITSGSPAAVGDLDTFDAKNSDDWWVSKSWGGTYAYTNGKAVSVQKGDTLDVRHGGKHVEVAYDGAGNLKSVTESGGGVNKEKRFNKNGSEIYWRRAQAEPEGMDSWMEQEMVRNPRTGGYMQYNVSRDGGAVTFSTKFMPTFSTSIDVSSLSTKVSTQVNAISTATAAMKTNLDYSAMIIALEAHAAHLMTANTNWEFRFPGCRTRGTLTPDLDTKITTLQTGVNDLDTKVTDIGNRLIKLES